MINPVRFYCANLGVKGESPGNFYNMLTVIDLEEGARRENLEQFLGF